MKPQGKKYSDSLHNEDRVSLAIQDDMRQRFGISAPISAPFSASYSASYSAPNTTHLEAPYDSTSTINQSRMVPNYQPNQSDPTLLTRNSDTSQETDSIASHLIPPNARGPFQSRPYTKSVESHSSLFSVNPETPSRPYLKETLNQKISHQRRFSQPEYNQPYFSHVPYSNPSNGMPTVTPLTRPKLPQVTRPIPVNIRPHRRSSAFLHSTAPTVSSASAAQILRRCSQKIADRLLHHNLEILQNQNHHINLSSSKRETLFNRTREMVLNQLCQVPILDQNPLENEASKRVQLQSVLIDIENYLINCGDIESVSYAQKITQQILKYPLKRPNRIFQFLYKMAEATLPVIESINRGNETESYQPGNYSETSSQYENYPLMESYRSKENIIVSSSILGTSENELVTDVLFVLQGIESRCIQFDENFNNFVLYPSIKVSSSVRSLVSHLCSVGVFYRKISKAITANPINHIKSFFLQAFIRALEEQLLEYLKFISVIENDKNSYLYKDDPIELELTLRRLMIWLIEPYSRMRLLSEVVDETFNCNGGALLSTLYAFSKHGNPENRKMMLHLLEKSTHPLIEMIECWMQAGELRDPHMEFFVVENPSISSDMLWAKRFQLETDQVPIFLDLSVANTILLTGKSVNFIRFYCPKAKWEFTNILYNCTSTQDTSLDTENDFVDMRCELKIVQDIFRMSQKAATLQNHRLVSTLINDYSLLEHIKAMRRFLLLCDGDFFSHLMEALSNVLDEPVSSLSKYDLNQRVQMAMRNTVNASNTPEIIHCVDVCLRPVSNGQTGWDAFYLNYIIRSPLKVFFTQKVMDFYRKVFFLLWRTLHLSYALSNCWLQTLSYWRFFDRYQEVMQTLHEYYLFRAEMHHSITNLRSYFMYEVLDTAWKDFEACLKDCKDFDELLRLHEHYLYTIQMGMFLASGKDLEAAAAVLKYIEKLLDLANAFISLHPRLSYCASKYIKDVREGKQERSDADAVYGDSLLNELETMYSNYRENILLFLGCITEKNRRRHRVSKELAQVDWSYSVRALACRLDFNLFYKDPETVPKI